MHENCQFDKFKQKNCAKKGEHFEKKSNPFAGVAAAPSAAE